MGPDHEHVIDAREVLHEVTVTGDGGEPMQLFVLREIHGYEDVVKTLALFSSKCVYFLQFVEEEDNVEATENDPEDIQSVDEVLRVHRMMRNVTHACSP